MGSSEVQMVHKKVETSLHVQIADKKVYKCIHFVGQNTNTSCEDCFSKPLKIEKFRQVNEYEGVILLIWRRYCIGVFTCALEMIQLHSSAVQPNVSRLASVKSIKKTAVIFFSHMFEDIIQMELSLVHLVITKDMVNTLFRT